MKITTLGRASIGGTLGRLWTKAGHDVTALGREGGDAGDADVVLIAVPSGSVPDALGRVTGLEGKVVLDATNRMSAEPPAGHSSIAEYIKAQTGGPTAKVFNLNFGKLLEQAAGTSPAPGNIWVGDEEARDAVEQLTRDVGMEPLHGGPLELASVQESFGVMFMGIVADRDEGLLYYRFAAPESSHDAGSDGGAPSPSTRSFVNQLQAAPGRRDELVDLLRELAESIHDEPGGLHYSVHVPVDDPDGPVTTIQVLSSTETFEQHAAWMRPNLPRLAALLAAPPRPPVMLEQVPLSGHAREVFAG